MDFYETDEQLGQYLGFHYGDTFFGVPNYPVRCAEICLRLLGRRPRRRALDLGCAVGRTAFELARSFDEVVGVDLSERFIASAEVLRRDGHIDYWVRDEGELGHRCSVELASLGLSNIADRLRFEVGDAQALGQEHEGYDLIFAGNLLDRLSDPAAFLAGVDCHLEEGGLLVLSSPYTLLEDFTPRANWIGGFEANGSPRTVSEGLTRHLGDRFDRVATEEVPFVIRETRRKFQHTVAELSAWRKRTG